MIERYSITASVADMEERFGVEVPPYYKPRYNAAPTQLLPVITTDDANGLSVFYWGRSPQWAKNKPLSERLINLPLDRLQERPVFKRALMKTRCIAPADGFYAWKKVGKKTAVPYRCVTDQELFSLAGLWEEFEDIEGNMIHTFSLITLPANETIGKIQERMPVILNKKIEQQWLNSKTSEDELFELLKPYPADKMNVYTISPSINDVRNDRPSLLLPTPPADQFGNLTLFD